MKRTSASRLSKKATRQLTAWVLSAIVALMVFAVQSCTHKTTVQTKQEAASTPKTIEKVEIISVYDGDTFKVNIPCDMEVFCDSVSVRVRGVDTPEIKGKTEREKQLAKQAKKFTQDFLKKTPVSLHNCGRDKYFRLLCNVQNSTGKDLAEELIKAGLGYAYEGGTKSKQFQ